MQNWGGGGGGGANKVPYGRCASGILLAAGEPYASQHTTLYNSGVREEREKGGGLGREGFLPLPVSISVPLPSLRLPRRLTPG